MDAAAPMFWAFKYFPFIGTILRSAPEYFIMRMSPASRGFVDLSKKLEIQIDELLADQFSLNSVDHETIYHHLLTPQSHKGYNQVISRKGLLEEAHSLLHAGSETVGDTTVVGIFHVLNNRTVCAKLVKELEEAWPDKDSVMGFESLEKLPYLVG